MLPEAVLEVMDPCFGRRLVRLAKFPFTIGRGPENDLLLLDTRISRQCAAILYVDEKFRLEDRGNRLGVYLNAKHVRSFLLQDHDTISFGSADSYTLVFHPGPTRGLKDATKDAPVLEAPVHALHQVSLLLEAVALAQSELPMEDILALLVDRAIDVSGAARGALLQAQGEGRLQPVVARQRGARPLAPDTFRYTWWMELDITRAIEKHKSIFGCSTGNSALEVGYAKAGVLTWCCVPLWTQPQILAGDPTQEPRREQLLGLLYLDDNGRDSRSKLAGRDSFQLENILNALAMQAASVLTNARLVQTEQKRRQMEQELAIARKIQQSLLPKSFKHPEHLQVSGFNHMCLSVGGDYFDLMDLAADCTAFAIADVAGKGLGAALVTSMLQGAFSAMMLGAELIKLFDHTNRMVFERTEDSRYSTLFFFWHVACGWHAPLHQCRTPITSFGSLW
jgi:sigma-B regulation protein RsbU (phosphoserine phosphatase)